MVALELVVVAVLLSVLGLVGISIYLKRTTKTDEPERPAGRPAPRDVQRRAQLQRNRGARMRANAARQNEAEADEDEVRPHEPIPDVDEEGHKIGAKKKAKLEAKAEKRAQREAEEHQREERRKKEKVAEEERKKQDEKERAEEKRREEAERKAREEKERQEHEEYVKMKAAFMVEEEGFEEGDGGDDQNLLQNFVNYIKQNKVVVIEDLAAQFKLKTQSAIDRIKDLQNDDILTGIIDDRGKFIYVSEEELHAIAKFIKQRGRVSLTELAENSSQLINLAPATVS